MRQVVARVSAFRSVFLITLILLVPQYILGMATNLYVQFPSSLPQGNAWGWSFSQGALIPLHVYLGTALLVASLVALVWSVVARSVPGMITASLGLVMMLYAYLSGVSFLSSGQQGSASLNMALGFIGALIAYGVGYYLLRPAGKKSSL